MSNKKYILSLLLLAVIIVSSHAQTGVSSPMTRYGFGQLSDMVVGRSTAMGGVSMGLRAGQEVNIGNPASYSAVDSLTFLLDAGLTLEKTNYKSGKTKMNYNSASFDYVAMQFRLWPKIGMALGFSPFSRVGYKYSEKQADFGDIYSTATPFNTYFGEGGLTKAFVGAGWNPLKGFSLGVNVEYIFGNISHTATNSYSDQSIYSYIRNYDATINTFNATLGVQYEFPVSKMGRLTLGGTFTPGRNINKDAVRQDYLYDEKNTTIEGSHSDTIHNAFQLPTSFAIGLAYNHGRKLTIAADFSFQKWGSVKYPMTSADATGKGIFESRTGFLNDRKKVSVGLEYTPNYMSRNYLNRIRFRLGGYYSTQYANIDKYKAGKEYGLSAGLGLPIQNQFNNRSVVNITAQWVHVSPGNTQLVVENHFRLCLGLTFDERWFMKFKFD